MSTQTNTTVRMFGALQSFRKKLGLESMAGVYISPEGRMACDVASDLGLPLEKIEAVFINHKAHCLDRTIHPGDRVAFVPTGLPGSRSILPAFATQAGRGEPIKEKP